MAQDIIPEKNPTTAAPVEQPAASYTKPTIPAEASNVIQESGNETQDVRAKLHNELGVTATGEPALSAPIENVVVLPSEKINTGSTNIIDFAKAKKDIELAKKNFNTEDLHPSDVKPHKNLANKMGQLFDFMKFKKNRTAQQAQSSEIQSNVVDLAQYKTSQLEQKSTEQPVASPIPAQKEELPRAA